jgi:DNA-directed RNA polymerase subunit RPC12/RpoP
MDEKEEKKEGNYGCPRCNCRVVYCLNSELAKIPIAILHQNHDGVGHYAEEIAYDGRIKGHYYRCVDCGHEFDNPVWISAECYKGI